MALTKTGISYGDFAWNPAPGCTNGCPGCWARAMAKRFDYGCEKCRTFKPHLHPERLDDPAKRKKPTTILVNFMGDLCCGRDWAARARLISLAARQASWHHYVWLSQDPERMEILASAHSWPTNWRLGVTIRTQADWNERWKCLDPWRTRQWWWLSMEPLIESPYLSPSALHSVTGVIIGHDNRRGAPGTDTLGPARQIIDVCLVKGAKVYVKQLWIDGKLCHDPEEFPEDLRHRELAWPLYTKEP